MQDKILIVFARPPVSGKIKKRLAASLGTGAAMRIYRRLFDQALALAGHSGYPYRLYLSEPPPASLSLPDYLIQAGKDLGQRMLSAFRQQLAGFRKACLIGSDCPGLTIADIDEAFLRLDDHEVVLGPARDGGYYLIALSRPLEPLFAGINWGSDQVLDQTLALCRQKGYRYHLLQEHADVDRPEDIPPGWL